MLWWRKRPHAVEFRKTWGGAKSRKGFRIVLRRNHWVDYFDDGQSCSVFFELMGKRHGLILYRGDTRGFDGLSTEAKDRIFANIVRGLEFLDWDIDLAPG